MKFLYFILYISYIIHLHTCITLSHKRLPITPKATDLDNHYGTIPSENKYGPNTAERIQLTREGLTTGENIKITPITNLEQEIKHNEVVSGNLDNTSYDASKIINAHLTKPKIEINADIVHDAIIKTPVHLGSIVNEKEIHHVNKLNGEIDVDKFQIEKPLMGTLNNIEEVTTRHKAVVDLDEGKVINENKANLTYHGIN